MSQKGTTLNIPDDSDKSAVAMRQEGSCIVVMDLIPRANELTAVLWIIVNYLILFLIVLKKLQSYRFSIQSKQVMWTLSILR